MSELCLAPWFGLYINKRILKPCCLWQAKAESWSTVDDIKNFWNGEMMDETRKDFLNGKIPKRCLACSEYRIGYRKELYDSWLKNKYNKDRIVLNPPLKPLHVDINLSNICNMKCMICGSWASSNWLKDDLELKKMSPEFERNTNLRTILDSKIFKECKEIFSDVIRMDLKGGEPMIQPHLLEMIESLVRWGTSKQMELGHITNGSVINSDLLKLWKHFKGIRVTLSVDGINELFTYIRGYDFDTLEKHLYIYDKTENLTASYNVAISIYNVLDIADINNWFMTRECKTFPCLKNGKSQKFNCSVSDPSYLDPRILPKKYKEMALENILKYDHKNIQSVADWFKKLIDIPEDKKKLKTFVKFTNIMDKKRGTSFLKIKPEFEELFKEYS